MSRLPKEKVLRGKSASVVCFLCPAILMVLPHQQKWQKPFFGGIRRACLMFFWSAYVWCCFFWGIHGIVLFVSQNLLAVASSLPSRKKKKKTCKPYWKLDWKQFLKTRAQVGLGSLTQLIFSFHSFGVTAFLPLLWQLQGDIFKRYN